MKIVEKEPTLVEDDDRAVKEVTTDSKYAFAEEYSVSGWFKWVPLEK